MNISTSSLGNIYLDGRETPRSVFSERARRMANVLAEVGVEADQPVAILMRNDVAYLEVIEACRYLGAPYVALNWHASTPELIHILEDSKAKALVGHASLTAQFDETSGLYAKIFAMADPITIAGTDLLDNTDTGLHEDLNRAIDLAAPIASEPQRFRGLFAYTSGSTNYECIHMFLFYLFNMLYLDYFIIYRFKT